MLIKKMSTPFLNFFLLFLFLLSQHILCDLEGNFCKFIEYNIIIGIYIYKIELKEIGDDVYAFLL